MSIKLTIVPWLEKLIEILWKNKSQMMKLKVFVIDDLPATLVDELSSEQIEFLQENVLDFVGSYRTKTQFAKRLAEELSRGLVSIK